MNTVVLILAAVFQIHGVLGSPLTVMPQVNQFCEYDAFISSTPYNDKVFLHPWKKTERNADWFEARGYCAKNCAELVTIESDAENTFFLNFMRSINLSDAVWIGAEIENTTLFTWSNGLSSTYSAKAPGEYNEGGRTCANAGYVTSQNLWYNYYCTYANYLVACQRPASWTICGSGK